MKKLADDCFLHDKDRLRHDDAIAILKERLVTIAKTELLPLEAVAGRILAQDITAPRNIPSTDNAAVDGYAFAFNDHEPTGGFFPISTRIPAGQTEQLELPGFSAARIFTGAPMPQGSDTVAMQEDCERHDQDGSRFVIIPAGLKKGANCRKAGEDVTKGDSVSKKNQRLRPQDVAAIASTGVSEVSVFRKLRVGVLSSGDEILRPGDEFSDGQVYDANHYMLRSFMDTLPIEFTDLGISDDNPAQVETVLKEAAATHDVILSTGGASRGEEDHFVSALEKLGNCHLWQLAVKPGRPMSFGQIDNTPCFTLPGNPVAAFVCFLLYVRPSLLILAGCQWSEIEKYEIPSGFSLTSKPDRREFLRGKIIYNENGIAELEKFQRDGSGLISGLQFAGGLIEIPEETTKVDIGERINFIPLSQFF